MKRYYYALYLRILSLIQFLVISICLGVAIIYFLRNGSLPISLFYIGIICILFIYVSLRTIFVPYIIIKNGIIEIHDSNRIKTKIFNKYCAKIFIGDNEININTKERSYRIVLSLINKKDKKEIIEYFQV